VYAMTYISQAIKLPSTYQLGYIEIVSMSYLSKWSPTRTG
jgi:hypothetical protein